MHALLVLLSLFLPFAFVQTVPDDKPCTAHDGDRFYDLTPLQSSTDYEFTSPSGQKFVINVCRSVVHETWNVGVDAEKVGGFISKDHGDFSIGEVNTTLQIQDKHPLLILKDGSPCPTADHMHAMTAVRFVCDRSVFGSGSPRLVAQLPPQDDAACAFFLEWRTHYACPAGEEAGFWGGLVVGLSITIIIVLMLGLVGGTLYRRYVLQLHGFEQIPRISFFSFTGALDALQMCGDRLLGRRGEAWHESSQTWTTRGGGRGRGFDRLPTLPEEEEAIMGGADGRQHEPRDEGPAHEHGVQAAEAPTQGGDGVIRL